MKALALAGGGGGGIDFLKLQPDSVASASRPLAVRNRAPPGAAAPSLGRADLAAKLNRLHTHGSSRAAGGLAN